MDLASILGGLFGGQRNETPASGPGAQNLVTGSSAPGPGAQSTPAPQAATRTELQALSSPELLVAVHNAAKQGAQEGVLGILTTIMAQFFGSDSTSQPQKSESPQATVPTLQAAPTPAPATAPADPFASIRQALENPASAAPNKAKTQLAV